MLAAAFDPLRQAGAGHPAILIRLVETIGELKVIATEPAQRTALAAQLGRIEQTAAGQPFTDADREDILSALRAARHSG